MERVRYFWKCLTGPTLYRRHQTRTSSALDYVPFPAENLGNSILGWVRFITGFLYWSSPFLILPMYKRGWFTADGISFMIKYAGVLGFAAGSAVFLQGVGRYQNAEYWTFIAVLHEVLANPRNLNNRRNLRLYDFDFRWWPVDYDALLKTKFYTDWSKPVSRPGREMYRTRKPLDYQQTNPLIELLFAPISYVAAHTFGRRMMYPGCTALVNSMVHVPLVEGRAKLIETNQGVRAKLKTLLGNEIDTVLIDRRGDNSFNNRDTLVICFEGNSGFYEIGCPSAPVKAGYSVLGANRPGFGGSTGAPWPHTEKDFAQCLMTYATEHLSFPVDQIVVFAWSIGGFPASYIAQQYQDIKAVILDATFDDALPLALPRMPEFCSSITVRTVRKYLNLTVADHLIHYRGPVRLIRRYRDEMIATGGPDEPGTNRGNALLHLLLQSRYPQLLGGPQDAKALEMLRRPVSQIDDLLEECGVDDEWCEHQLLTATREALQGGNEYIYPLSIGHDLSTQRKTQLLLYLIQQTMTQFDTTHCTPLPSALFQLPWDPKKLCVQSSKHL